jgi:hypothetical protein
MKYGTAFSFIYLLRVYGRIMSEFTHSPPSNVSKSEHFFYFCVTKCDKNQVWLTQFLIAFCQILKAPIPFSKYRSSYKYEQIFLYLYHLWLTVETS